MSICFAEIVHEKSWLRPQTLSLDMCMFLPYDGLHQIGPIMDVIRK